jgi:hypothetical protein
MVDTGSGGLCRLIVAVLEIDWADHTDLGVPSSAVVDPFDPVADCESTSDLRRPGVSVVELRFQCAPEGFGLGVVKAHPRPTDRLGHVVSAGESCELPGGVLRTAVGVKPDPA